jgi:hypothetical protein
MSKSPIWGILAHWPDRDDSRGTVINCVYEKCGSGNKKKSDATIAAALEKRRRTRNKKESCEPLLNKGSLFNCSLAGQRHL